MDSSKIVPLLLAVFIAWRMYVRLRRNIGRQAMQPKRMLTRVIILAVVTVALTAFSLLNLRVLAGLGFGFVLGLPLAWVGLKMTRFEATAEGRFYTPNSTIGIGLGILLVGRLVYRLMVILPNMRNAAQHPQQPALMQSPLSLFVFGLLAGYYIAYYVGVLARNRAMSRSV
jgi:hypothetical protein